jgi:hypothetical protein
MTNRIVLFLSLALSASEGYSQQLSYFDAAQAYNRILLENGSGTYQRINAYRVRGTQYLFGEKHNADLYAKGETGTGIKLSYNTYNQEIEFYGPSNPNKALIKSAEEIDSFRIKANAALNLAAPITFVNGKYLSASANQFYQQVHIGNKYSLYKKYKSVLGIVTTNYIDADVRQFDLEYEYHYFDHERKELKKLKLNQAAVKKEFKSVAGIDGILENYPLAVNPEVALGLIFQSLN